MSNIPKCNHAPGFPFTEDEATLCQGCGQPIRWGGVGYVLASEPTRDSKLTTSPHRSAIAAMYLYGEDYAAQRLGADAFWHQLSEAKKKVCRNLVLDIEKHQPEPGYVVQSPSEAKPAAQSPSCLKRQLGVEACTHGCPVADECYAEPVDKR